MPNNEQDQDWTAVIARCLAYLCLKQSEHVDAKLLDQAEFLQRLGVPEGDCAGIVGTSRNSLGTLARLAKKKKGAKVSGTNKRK